MDEEWKIEFENEFAHLWGHKTLITERIEDFIQQRIAAGEKSGAGKAIDHIRTELLTKPNGKIPERVLQVLEAARSISGEEV